MLSGLREGGRGGGVCRIEGLDWIGKERKGKERKGKERGDVFCPVMKVRERGFSLVGGVGSV